ncbi:hypothetical protein [Flexilinea flocculi]|jgi:hypothetical protein|uniref:Uncharacterized protein n=1 Tax=Flexilinea flocculi TaxID=1678840 RepID=A0A0K8PAK6_9CHLR|nr:hypothetical protein [Flexilinea flocculi]GAP39687.1 hypothetical protein ATC1_12221 [Flexilinea flocculi]
MKKNRILIVLFVFITILFAVSASFYVVEDKTTEPIGPKNLLNIADREIFIRDAFGQNFSEEQGYVNEMINTDTIHQYYIYDGKGTDVLMSMLPSEISIKTSNKRLTFEQVRKDEFHVTYSVQQKENIPAKTGGKCWIRYSNVVLMGKGRESGVILYPGENAYFFTPVDSEITYEKIADLSNLNPEKKNKFDFFRLSGTVYVYGNGEFLFSYEDKIKETVSFESGSELSEGGNRIRCDYDDFTMRIK